MKYYNNNWSTELEKYKNGTHSETERFQLEKSALDDSFLFDALEGYSTSAGVKKDNEVVPGAAKNGATIFSMRNIAVAASLVLLVGVVGYMKTQIGGNSENQTISAVEQENEIDPSKVSQTQIAMNDQVTEAAEDVTEINNTEENISQNSIESVGEKPSNDLVKPQPKAAVKEPVSVRHTKPSTKIAADVAVDSDEVEKPSQKSVSKKTKNKLNISTPKGELKLGNGQRTTLTGVKIQDSKAAPVMGWEAFENYIDKNKNKIATLKKVKVKVSFSINADGTLSNVKAGKTSCKACEKDAVNLIKSSGLWSNTQAATQNASYEIRY